MNYQVKLTGFSGPFDLLLELIESKELEITELSLADVTDDYLKRMESQNVPPSELADFLVVAAKLIYLKSGAIMPTLQIDEQETGDSLAAQLRLYREFVDAAAHIEQLLQLNQMGFIRPRAAIADQIEVDFRAPENVDPTTLRLSFERLLKKLEPFLALQEQSMKKVVSVQQRIRDIQRIVLERSRMTFKEITSGASSKVDVVVSFLALLELMKQKVVTAAQKQAFGDIELKRVN